MQLPYACNCLWPNSTQGGPAQYQVPICMHARPRRLQSTLHVESCRAGKVGAVLGSRMVLTLSRQPPRPVLQARGVCKHALKGSQIMRVCAKYRPTLLLPFWSRIQSHIHTHTHIHMHTRTYTRPHTYTRKHTHAQAYTRARTHARTHTCTCTHAGPVLGSLDSDTLCTELYM